MSQDLLLLVDGSSYLYRAFHALPQLTNSKGQATGAMYGVINMLKSLLNEYQPKYVAVVFDAKGKTFRHDMYPDYKANRPPMPPELAEQIQPLHDVIKAMHLPLLCVENVEADDVIGTLAKHAQQSGMKTLISTGDKDMAQLVNSDVTLINTMNNAVSDEAGVLEKFGVPPKLIIDYLALIGDTSDNVPGVPKVGPKTAVKWLNEHGSLDNIMHSAETFGGKIGDNLRASLQQLPLSKQLVTIDCDVKLNYKVGDLMPGEPNNEKLIELYKQYEFKTWLRQLLGDAEEQQQAPEKANYETILTEKDFNDWLVQLKSAEVFAFDVETTSLNYMDARVVGFSFAVAANKAAYLPIAHHYMDAPEQLDETLVFKALKPILESDDYKKVGHNLKYDKEVLANHDINLQGIAYDTMLESYVIDSTATRHDLDTLALKYLGHKNIKFEEVAGKGAKQITFDQVALDQATPYAAEDADICLQLHHKLWPRIDEDEKLKAVFNDIELPVLTILSQMERTGVMIDAPMLLQQSQTLAKQILELEQQAHAIGKSEFNLNSPKQLQEVLFNKLNLPIIKKTPTGQASTAEEVLSELALDYPLPKIILEYRSLSKLKSTYTDKLPQLVNPRTGRIHTSYHQAVAGTGRLSSSDPNLQNIPVRTEQGRAIRKAFIAPEGCKIVSADYSQIELRIMAHLSADKGLLDAFSKGLDVHRATAAQIFGVSLSEVSDEQRRRAKAVNFGLIYGMSAFGLAKQIGVERQVAQAYIDAYFEKYPGVHDYMEKTRALAHETGFVETLFGRRLHLSEINAKNMMRQKAAERAAINAPMQGTAADIIKRAMIIVQEWLTTSKINAKMIMQVHDELVFEVAESDLEQLMQQIPTLMASAAELAVPLIADINSGENWEEAH